MSKIQTVYPQIRVAIYGLLTAVLGGAAVFGLLTQDQVESYLGYGAAGLGALGTLLALVNVKTAAPTVDAPAIAEELAQRIALPTPEQVHVTVTETVDDVRRRIEDALGHRRVN